jgi:hypothetical protein
MSVAVVVVVAGVVAGAFSAPNVEEIAHVVKTAPSSDVAARLEAVTRPFLDAPYVLSPLGEGKGAPPDEDPRLRFDAFDCTTFVETALALALSSDLDEATRSLDIIRYREARPTFPDRRHFPEAEWIPQLTAAGLVEDITRSVGGDDVVVEEKRLSPQVWRKARHKGLPTLSDARIPDGTFALDVWPLDAAAQHPERIPSGTILHLVRADFGSVPVRVSHQALVLDVKGVKVVRHAADRLHHRVVDEPIDRFFARMKKYGKWPVTGIHLTRVSATPGWRERLMTSTAQTTSEATSETTTPVSIQKALTPPVTPSAEQPTR